MLARSLALIFLTATLIYFQQVRILPQDRLTLLELMRENEEFKKKKEQSKAPTEQKRKQVIKDIWPSDESLHLHIQSKSSELILKKEGPRLTLVETLQGVKASFRDDFFLCADQGTYLLPSHEFTIEQNCVMRQNQRVVYSPKVTFCFNDYSILCDSPRGLFENDLRFSAEKLLWSKTDQKLHLQGDVHFSFTPEEENSLDALLKQYL